MFRKQLFFTILILVFVGNTSAQKTEKEYINILDSAKAFLFEGDIDQSVKLYKEIIDASHLIKNDSIVSEALAKLASTYSILGLQDSIFPLVRQALTLENPGNRAMMDIHTHIGYDRRNAP